jgi:hypothetical protein
MKTIFALLCWLFASLAPLQASGGPAAEQQAHFPKQLNSYTDTKDMPVVYRILARAKADPFNVAATSIFFLAILHTFGAVYFQRMAKRAEHAHHAKLSQSRQLATGDTDRPDEVSFKATLFEFLGEVEAIFALWAIPLLAVAAAYYSWADVEKFVALDASFTEPMFVVVIMAMAATRPVIFLAETILEKIARLGGSTPAAWWCTVLLVGPLLGSFITEPGAMTISALILARRFYSLNPSTRLKYATLGLLFVNVSIGGVLTNFAAPPVLVVKDTWHWSSLHMLTHYGIYAVLAVALNVAVYFGIFRKEINCLAPAANQETGTQAAGIPLWIVLVHVLALGWTVFVAHYPPLFIAGFLFFLAFCQATGHHQDSLRLRSPLMVGFFLAGLVIHGKLQAWWLEPILQSDLNPWGLHLGSAILTSFNDNALITLLASQVELGDAAKHAIMSGAVAGGGLTVIANAPNPAGQSLLKSFFPDEAVAPIKLIAGALLPTAIAILCFMVVGR